MRLLDQVAAWLVCSLGAAHLAIGHAVFMAPNDADIQRLELADSQVCTICSGAVLPTRHGTPLARK